MALLRNAPRQAILLLFLTSAGYLDARVSSTPAVPQIGEIVQQMQQREARQARVLKHYDALRHYQVQYKGFKANISAAMDVQVNYEAAAGKSFRIVSQSGSKLLCDKVLKRAIESEKEASQNSQSAALSPANYRFQLTGRELLDGRPAYVLQVEPLRPGKFLYRGKVWVDADSFAVRKIEVEPAKNPSFWISSTKIENTNAEFSHGVWLSQKNRSESRIRIGGTAVLTIDYGTYHVVLFDEPRVQ